MTHILSHSAVALRTAFLLSAGAIHAEHLRAHTAPPPASASRSPWSVSAKRVASRDVEITTSEGTWMSVDVSPDGRTLVFDLLGDIYSMPIAGGTATLLLGGPAYESMPRYSPDGARIAFTSDRDGIENIWTMGSRGDALRQVSSDRERQISNPAWTPDGRYIVARKHFRNTRSLGAGEMWLYHAAGSAGIKLTDRRNWEQNATEPTVSPDGRYVYFSEDVSPGNNFQYNRNPHAGVYAIQRLDRETGRRSTWLQQTGSAMRPQLLPDGGTMAYLSRLFVARHGARGLRSSPKTLPAALPPQHVPVYDVFECFSTCTTVWFRRSATTPK